MHWLTPAIDNLIQTNRLSTPRFLHGLFDIRIPKEPSVSANIKTILSSVFVVQINLKALLGSKTHHQEASQMSRFKSNESFESPAPHGTTAQEKLHWSTFWSASCKFWTVAFCISSNPPESECIPYLKYGNAKITQDQQRKDRFSVLLSWQNRNECCNTLQNSAILCNTLQHSATLDQIWNECCNTLRHTAPHCNTLQHSVILCKTRRNWNKCHNTLQYVATFFNTQHIWNTELQ